MRVARDETEGGGRAPPWHSGPRRTGSPERWRNRVIGRSCVSAPWRFAVRRVVQTCQGGRNAYPGRGLIDVACDRPAREIEQRRHNDHQQHDQHQQAHQRRLHSFWLRRRRPASARWVACPVCPALTGRVARHLLPAGLREHDVVRHGPDRDRSSCEGIKFRDVRQCGLACSDSSYAAGPAQRGFKSDNSRLNRPTCVVASRHVHALASCPKAGHPTPRPVV